MFSNCINFNQPISLNTILVQTMFAMFKG